MKLQDARDIYERHSTKLSDVVRQLNFAGIAIIWLLRAGDNTLPYSKGLLWPLGLFAGSATFDLFHYAYASAAWGIFHRLQEKKPKNNAETEIHAPGAINWISLIFLGKNRSHDRCLLLFSRVHFRLSGASLVYRGVISSLTWGGVLNW